jgi:hypothetical protein
MKNNVNAAHRSGNRLSVADVTTYHFNIVSECCQILFFSGAEIVQHTHLFTLTREPFADVTADEARAAGD